MKIFLYAVLAGFFTWSLFFLYDLNKKRGNTDQQKMFSPLDYSKYTMTLREWFFYSLLAGIILYLIGMVFYQNLIVAFLFSALGFYYPHLRKKEIIEKRKQELALQFKQALMSISSSLTAGKSVENAFMDTVEDLKLLYPDPNTFIIREFEWIIRKIENGEAIETALSDFGLRSDIEDIMNFADVFQVSKRSGGDLAEIMRRTVNIISEKLEIQQEISVLIAQKKLEAKILSIAPFIMVALIRFSSPDYMEPLYGMGIGPVIMTIALLLLFFSYWLTERIMKIKV